GGDDGDGAACIERREVPRACRDVGAGQVRVVLEPGDEDGAVAVRGVEYGVLAAHAGEVAAATGAVVVGGDDEVCIGFDRFAVKGELGDALATRLADVDDVGKTRALDLVEIETGHPGVDERLRRRFGR